MNFSEKILFDIQVNEEVKTLEHADLSVNPRLKRLCTKCDEYNKNKRFKAGNHDLSFIATDYAGNVGNVNVSLFVNED